MNKTVSAILIAIGIAIVLPSCQKAPELSLTGPATIELSADGSSGSISFIANRDWTASCSEGWIHVNPSSGSATDGQITVSIRCDANTTYNDRSGTVTIKAEDLMQSITVRQPANLAIIVATKEYNLSSEARSFEVEVQANVQYSVYVSDGWVRQAGTKGLTKNILVFDVEENPTYDNRSASITIKSQDSSVPDQVIRVKQAQKDALVVKDSSFNMPYGGGEVEVKVESNVTFDVDPDADWIHFVQTKAMSSSTICLAIDENKTYGSRTGTVKIAQKNGTLTHTITINQQQNPGLFVSKKEFDLTNAAQTIEVEVQKNVNYTVVIDDACKGWITKASTKALSTDVVTFSIAANTDYDDRTGKVTIKQTDGNLSETIVVHQGQAYGLFITKPEYDLSNESHTLSVEVKANVEFKVESKANWIKHVETKGLTTSTITLMVDANESYDNRTGTVLVKQTNGNLSGTVTINQKQTDGLFVTPTGFELSNEAQTVELDVKNNVSFDVVIPDEAKNWIHVQSNTQTKALVNDKVTLAVAQNDSYDARKASVTIKQIDGRLAETVVIIQSATKAILVSPTEIELPCEGGSATICVESNVEVSAAVRDKADWVSLTKNSQTKGLEKILYTVSVPENNGVQREAFISFYSSGIEETVHLVQKESTLTISATTLDADCLDGATVSVQINAANDWTARETDGSMLSLSKDSGSAGSETITITVNGANCSNTDRVTKLVFECSGICKTLEIKQVPAFRFDSIEHTIPSSGGTYKFGFCSPRPFQSVTIRTQDYDDGFYDLLFKTGEDLASPQGGMDTMAQDASPVKTYLNLSYDFKPNYSKNSRTGHFRLGFEENGQTLVSEWITVNQLGDESAEDEADGVATVLQKHKKGTGVPIVILGDGFTKSDIDNGVFAQAATKAFNYLFTVEPMTALREYFDVWSVTAVSASSTFDGYGTRFGSKITSGTHIDGNSDLAYRYASKVVPANKINDMTVIVVMNMTQYAGTCYSHYYQTSDKIVMTYSVAFTPMTDAYGTTFENVIHHEVCGHGIGILGDEYGGNGTISSAKSEQLLAFHEAGAYYNVDLNSDVESTSWAEFGSDTRFAREILGAYEGAYTYDHGVYRPSQTSIMVNNKGIFNAPSRAQIYKRVMSIANDWNWVFDYEGFVRFDAPFRSSYYSSSSSTQASAPRTAIREEFIPLAPPVLVEDKRF